ncbi:MAG TPA: tetratricopeptide repeat protein, partial [Candidatus Limnocylindrales bacterium]|nr:tetratricopeptide repeat protein [Candidatus Limnocylindrales bacterium]
VTLPGVLLLLDFWPLQRFQISNLKFQIPNLWRLVLEKLPFLFLAFAASIVTFLAQRAGGAVSSITVIPLSMRISNAVVAYVRYLLKTLWPLNLSPFYPYQAHWPLTLVFLSATVLITVTVACVMNARRRPYMIFGWLWFLGTLVPAIGLVQVGSQSIADRYMYIPSIGLFVLLVWSMAEVRRSFGVRLPVLAGAGSATLLVCLILTETQLSYWHDGVKLFQHALEVAPGNYVAYNYLGNAYDDLGEKDKALVLCSESVRLSPHYVEGQYNLGTILLDLGRTEEAARCLSQAMEDDSGFVRAYNNLGKALLTQGQLQPALDRFREAVRLKPDWPEAHYNLGTVLLTASKPAEAITQFSEALRLNPRYAEAHMNWAIAESNLGNTTQALEHFAEAVRLSPQNPEARLNFGLALLGSNKPREAASQFASGLQLRPGDTRMQSHLAEALAHQ